MILETIVSLLRGMDERLARVERKVDGIGGSAVMKVRFKNVAPEYGARPYRVIENLPQSDFYICVMNDDPVPDNCIRYALPKVHVEQVSEEQWVDVSEECEFNCDKNELYHGTLSLNDGDACGGTWFHWGYRLVKVEVLVKGVPATVGLCVPHNNYRIMDGHVWYPKWAFRVEKKMTP